MRREGRIIGEIVVKVAIAVSQDHARVQQLPKRFGRMHQPEVIQHLMPKPRIEQMQNGVLGSAHVQIDRHPILFGFLGPRLPGIAGVTETKVIPATAGPLGHGIGVTQGLVPGLGIRHFHPIADASQGRFKLPTGTKIFQLGKHHRQLRFRNEFRRAVFKVQHGKRLPPIPLPAEEPIAQFIIHGPLTLAVLRQPVAHAGLGLGGGQSVQEVGIHVRAITRIRLGGNIAAGDDFDNRQVHPVRKGIIPRIMRRNRHDRTGSIGRQHVIRNPDRNGLARNRVHGTRSGEDPGLLTQFGQARPFAPAGHFFNVGLHRRTLLGSRDGRHQ